MTLTSFYTTRYAVHKNSMWIMVLVIMAVGKIAMADSLSYSPDQWPRHWSKLVNEKNSLNSQQRQFDNHNRMPQPARSPAWGMLPDKKKKSRRSVRPEYNTQSHIQHVPMNGMYPRGFYPGYQPMYPGYGYGTPLAVPAMNPYITPLLAPGLAAPGIPLYMQPYNRYPYAGGIPFNSGWPTTGYMW